MVPIQLNLGFEIAGVHFNRRKEKLAGWSNPDNYGRQSQVVYDVDLVTNYAALKHLVRSGHRYVGANDNDMNKAA